MSAELCERCGRPRPTYIADPTCPAGGGYCQWTEKPPKSKSWAERIRDGTPAPKPPDSHLAIARWFRLVALFDDKARAHLGVDLTHDNCIEVARILESGIGMHECRPKEPL